MADETYAPLVPDRDNLNEVKFAARDYPGTFDALLRRIKAEYGTVYTDFATTSVGVMLVELFAYAVAQLQWYLDRTASDCFLDTARTREAVQRIVKQLGYKMGPAAAASTTLTLTFPDGTTAGFTMPARWRYQGPDSLVFESVADVVEPFALAPGATVDVAVRQGETRWLTFTADGSENQEYRLANVATGRYVADGSVQCWVAGLEWDEESFLTYDRTNQFEVEYQNEPPLVRFGDGIAGNMPPVGAEVKVRFVIIDGVKGNMPKAHSIQRSLDTLLIAGTAVSFDVDNATQPNGGADPEEADQARRVAPASFAARGAAITQPDYQALANSYVDALYGRVAKAYASNPRGAYEDVVFNALIEDIEVLLAANTATAGAFEVDVLAAATALAPALAALVLDVTEMDALRTDMVTAVGTAKSQAEGAQGELTTAEGACTRVQDVLAQQKIDIDAVESYVNANVAAPHRAAIIALLATVENDRATANTQATTAAGAASAAATAVNTALTGGINPTLDDLTNLVPVAPDTSMPSIQADITTQVGVVNAQVAIITARATALQGTAAALEVSVATPLGDMHTRIGELFSDDCLSNYVQVPILGVDADGFYVAPSVGLLTGLQTYLDGIKEVTQQVEVVDGASVLVPAVIQVALEVGPAYVYDEVAAAVGAAVRGLLKGRDFDEPLYLSTLYDICTAASVGVVRVNVDITGPVLVPPVIDSLGNLVPPANRIVTLGTLTIVPV